MKYSKERFERVLEVLKKYRELPQPELTKKAKVPPSVVSMILRDLERQGVIERYEHREGRNKWWKVVRLKEESDVEESQTEQAQPVQPAPQPQPQPQVTAKTVPDDLNRFLRELSAILNIDRETIMREALRDWALRHGISFGKIKSVYGVPVVSSKDVHFAGEVRDVLYPTVTRKVYRIPGFREEFEELDFAFHSDGFNDLREACRVAKVRADVKNLLAVVVHDEVTGRYKILVERYDILKDKLEVLERWRSEHSQTM